MTSLALGGRGSLASLVIVSSAGSGARNVSVPSSTERVAVIEAPAPAGRAGRHDLVDAAHAGDLRQAELLGRLRADLGGVAVDRLPAAEDEIGRAQMLDRARERVASGQRVGAGEGAVGEQDRPRRRRGTASRAAPAAAEAGPS